MSRIVEVVPSLGTTGGVERFVLATASELIRRGISTAVVCLTSRTGSVAEGWFTDRGIEVHYLGKRKGLDLSVVPRLDRIISDLQPEVVHTHLHVDKYLVCCPSLWAVKTRCHTVHLAAAMEMGHMDRSVEHGLYRFAHFIPVAISTEVRTSICDLYGLSDCALIRNGVEIPHERTKTGADASCLFLNVGRLSEQKNHRMLLSAFALVRRVCPGARLEIAGEGPLRQVLEEYAQSLGLSDSVVFLGLRSDIPQLLQAADAFVLSSSYEGLSIALLEAMASGLPVVTTAVEGVNDVMTDGQTGMVVALEDTVGFAQSMVRLTQSVDLRRSMGSAAREVVQSRYSIVRQVDEYVRLLGLA